MTERIYEAQHRAFSLLEEKGLDAGAIRFLMEHITGFSHASLLANMRTYLTEEQHHRFWQKVDELLEGKPVQYVIGHEVFYGRTFQVNENVLIPRPETEELIVEALKRMKKLFGESNPTVADIGTGSGAIAITMKLESPQLEVTATDISESALRVAKQNATELGAAIDFKQGDLTEPLAHKTWDVVLSNPPYIARSEASEMTDTVLDYEPHRALFAEEDGLYCYRKLAEQLPKLMNKPGLIGVEFGHAQGRAVYHLFSESFPNAVIETVKDINGKDRMLFCEIRE
ncbi:peptide chain release factor N(5)-glutamine methyltransferase [Sporosarcina pasteurii]|uniref:Release factor glutamine methyltransferase n=1 Tax=Sporosarcina pasteurii TaxID=1474 RepID=A0A380BCK3_SPOPA|nr:peptide chain release factor N(5)-glutamine methyltransferase [Sporosarcina pasteurii]MDS9472286.1 peptide chain release factor N(5)-glutamine methyltransferase [Sporosarcina pasteurii]QBQ06267.1 peptide chain release factor N(5)-glutamine methyltransferase [Sporosarcina pasteurii]SUI99092.1 Release factor glutamine methyltransferase [Sporosarcina pasteurii]